MNKTIVITNVILLTIMKFLFPSNGGGLSGIYKPDMIDVEGNQLYVLEGTSIHIFDLKDLKLLIKFGRKGEGPGELKQNSIFPNWLKVLPDSTILVNSYDKMIIFSKDGELITERRKKILTSQMTPVGKNFVAEGSKFENKTTYVTITLYNPEMKLIKELYAQPFTLQSNDMLYLIMDFLNFQVEDDKIFIEESPEGFIIELFDSEGRQLDKIEKKYNKMTITKRDQDNALESLSKNPAVRVSGGWETVKQVYKFKFADFFPAIQDIKVNNKKIYIKTFKMINNKEEYVIMDLKGEILKTVYLQKVESSPLYHNVLGAKLYTIKDDKIYYLKENEEQETWELHVEEINL